MQLASLETYPARFVDIVRQASVGEEIILTLESEPVARITPIAPKLCPRKPGSGCDAILHIADDFDATPEGFEEYMLTRVGKIDGMHIGL